MHSYASREGTKKVVQLVCLLCSSSSESFWQSIFSPSSLSSSFSSDLFSSIFKDLQKYPRHCHTSSTSYIIKFFINLYVTCFVIQNDIIPIQCTASFVASAVLSSSKRVKEFSFSLLWRCLEEDEVKELSVWTIEAL